MRETMSSRLQRVLWRIAASVLIGLTLVGSVASGANARSAQTGGARHGAWTISGAPIRGAVKAGEVNLATLAPASAAQVQAAASGRRPPASRTPAQQAAYRQWAVAHPTALPQAMGLAVSATGPNTYGNGALPVLTSAHAGLDSTNGGVSFGTPDPSLAAAPGYIVQATDNLLVVYNTSYGLKYGPWTPAQLFASVMLPNDKTFSSPSIAFDAERAIYLIAWTEDDVNAINGTGVIDVAISKTSSPSPLSNFLVYQLPFPNGNGCFSPALGYDYWGLYVSCLEYDNITFAFLGNATFALSLGKLLAGAAQGALYNNVPTAVGCSTTCDPAFVLSPTIEDGVPQAEWITATDQGELPQGGTSNNLTLCALTNTHGLASGVPPVFSCGFNALPTSYGDLMSAAQPGTTALLASGVGYMQVAYRNGQLSLAMTSAMSCSGSTRSGVVWAVVTPQLSTLAAHNPQQVNSLAPAYTQAGYWCHTNADILEPSLIAGTEGDVALVYGVSSSTIYPSLAYTGRTAADAPNTLGQGGSWAWVIQGSAASGNFFWGLYTSCGLVTNLVTRGLVRCVSQYGGPHTSLGGSGWDTELYALRME